MAIDWLVFLAAVKRKLGLTRRRREATPHAEAAGAVAVVADLVRLADGAPAEIGKMVVLQPGPIGSRRLGATLVAIEEVDRGGKRWLVLGILSGLPCVAGYRWVMCLNVDPAHCVSGISRGLESLPPGQETAGQKSQNMIVPSRAETVPGGTGLASPPPAF